MPKSATIIHHHHHSSMTEASPHQSFRRQSMRAKATHHPSLRYHLLLLLSSCFLWAVVSSTQNTDPSTTPPPPSQVLEAIKICREKLAVDPHFPKIQYSLAQLLDSQISHSSSSNDDYNDALVAEVLQLYLDVGQPSSSVIEKRIPPAKIRFASLTRAGTIAKDILRDIPQATKIFSLAMSLDGIEDASILLAFEAIMPTLISSVTVEDQMEVIISPEGITTSGTSSEHQTTQVAFDLCNVVDKKCPKETIGDQYRGALLRRMKQPELAYQSYHRAVVKSEKNMMDAEAESDPKSLGNIALVGNFVRTSVLASAAAREGGENFQRQMNYLLDAEKLAAPLFASIMGYENQDIVDEHAKESFKDLIVDLYNNMGITEKKQGSFKRARDFFAKALEINPKDGHALVQLASVDDGSNVIDNVVSSAKDLDPEYVSALFDGYSSRFESELVDVLQYKGHVLLHNAFMKALRQLGRSPLSVKKVVDLGCGTGLLGELVANEMPWVEVSGVDLSQRMIDIAQERKSRRGRSVYASLSNADAAKYLSNLDENSIDSILASDVIIYVGDISKVLEESSKCLIDDGLIGFTAETIEGSEADGGVRLLPCGRFGHSRSYVNNVAKLAGFEVLSWDDCVIRQQANLDVIGASIILKKI